MAIADDLMDRLKGAIVETSAGTAAIRVQYVTTSAAAITTRTLPDNLMDRLKNALIASSATDGDGAPALRARSV